VTEHSTLWEIVYSGCTGEAFACPRVDTHRFTGAQLAAATRVSLSFVRDINWTSGPKRAWIPGLTNRVSRMKMVPNSLTSFHKDSKGDCARPECRTGLMRVRTESLASKYGYGKFTIRDWRAKLVPHYRKSRKKRLRDLRSSLQLAEMSRVFLWTRHALQRRDWLADDAVSCEPVSSLPNWEMQGNFDEMQGGVEPNPAKSCLISSVWMVLSLLPGAGRRSFLAGRVVHGEFVITLRLASGTDRGNRLDLFNLDFATIAATLVPADPELSTTGASFNRIRSQP